jgi:DNA-binding transcriptional regulator GbsR (MarR family)
MLENIFKDTSYMLQAIRYIVKKDFFDWFTTVFYAIYHHNLDANGIIFGYLMSDLKGSLISVIQVS